MKKIAIGNNINIQMDDCIIETDRIEIKDTINSSFTFNIIRDGNIIKTGDFSLAKEIEENGFSCVNDISGSVVNE